MNNIQVLAEKWRELECLTVDEVAQILRVSRTTAYKAVRSGEIPSTRIGRRDIISRAAIERLLAGGSNSAA